MPNHVAIRFTVVGETDRLRAFIQQARGIRKRTGDESGSLATSEDQEESPFVFDCLVPLPDTYSQIPYSPAGYEMEYAMWGVKWGAYEVEGPTVTETTATYAFTCAWSAPRRFCETLSRLWSDLLIVVSYGGEGPTLGHFALMQGAYLANYEEESEHAPLSPGEVVPTTLRNQIALSLRQAAATSVETAIASLPWMGWLRKAWHHLREARLLAAEARWIETYAAWQQQYLEQHESFVDALQDASRSLREHPEAGDR